MNTPTTLVAGTIRASMAAQDMDVRKLSRTTGIPYETLRRRIYGQGPFPLDQLFTIASALGTTPTELLTKASPETTKAAA